MKITVTDISDSDLETQIAIMNVDNPTNIKTIEQSNGLFTIIGEFPDETVVTAETPKEKKVASSNPSSTTTSKTASGLNAILSTFEPKGASDGTAKQDGLPARGIHGVAASEAMAKTDQAKVMKHKAKFIKAAEATNLPPALLAAIASRESRGGSALTKDGTGDGGHAFGIMQIDFRHHTPKVEDGPAGEAHILQAAKILQEKLKSVQHKFESLTDSSALQTAVSRYNGGKGHPAPNSDEGTTGNDYCNDVWARAQFYARVESW